MNTRHTPTPHAATIEFLIELRKRLLVYFATVGVALVGFVYWAKDLYSLLALPLLHHLPAGGGLIATEITAPFVTPFKLALISAMLATMPVLLYQLWAFVAPALYRHERRLVWVLLFFSSLLFYLGVAFAYFIVFPALIKFFIYQAPYGVEVTPDISKYLRFSSKLFFAFGMSFEMPVLVFLLVWSGTVRLQQLRQRRHYFIVGAFVMGMLFTPPDVISQLFLAIPLWLLFELGMIMAQVALKCHCFHLKARRMDQ